MGNEKICTMFWLRTKKKSTNTNRSNTQTPNVCNRKTPQHFITMYMYVYYAVYWLIAYKTGRFKCIDEIGCFPITLLLHTFEVNAFVRACVVLPPFVNKWYPPKEHILLVCWRVFMLLKCALYVYSTCIFYESDWMKLKKKVTKNCTNVAATTHKSFHFINIIKVIVTTLSVSNCFLVVQNHTHV